uniref:Uncharacterized protein n=1 Tax=Oryza sativa subsp. japonica TaxID=39947 RepID=Q8H4D1_ORYSJ|nr:hypothetical protein [Oryza sativa Japonica Group]
MASAATLLLVRRGIMEAAPSHEHAAAHGGGWRRLEAAAGWRLSGSRWRLSSTSIENTFPAHWLPKRLCASPIWLFPLPNVTPASGILEVDGTAAAREEEEISFRREVGLRVGAAEAQTYGRRWPR